MTKINKTRCTRCKNKIKGRIAYLETKPYCSVCFEIVKYKNTHCEVQGWLSHKINSPKRKTKEK
jgi:hypothetical protein